jgi:hypothetical protein
MKVKQSYTLEELCSGLSITLKKFCQQAGITEGTLINLRQGHAGRPSTVNSILAAFSKIYEMEFSLENVEGLTVQDKPHQKGKKPATSTLPIDAIPQQEVPQISVSEPKRSYVKKNKEKKSSLPDGCILATEFGLAHGIPRETFRDHMINGLGPGLIHGPNVPEDGTVQVRDYIRYEERNKRVRKDGTIETERYLTSEQQKAALEFWKRHDVGFHVCNDIGCWCHIVKNGE